jgi:hypothetical protein
VKKMEAQSNSQQISKEPSAKRAYRKPELVEYGNVRDFTRGPGGGSADAKGGAFG